MNESGRLFDALDELASLLLSKETIDSTMRRIAELAVSSVPGCAAAGISIHDDRGVTTRAATDPIVNVIDDLQTEKGEGPCLQAVKEDRVCSIESTSMDDLWPDFSRAAARHGVLSCLAFPLDEPGGVLGSLNLYAFSSNAFGQESAESGILLAAGGARPLTAMRMLAALQKRASALAKRLASPIAQATGILMEREHLDEMNAEALLLRMAQEDGLALEEKANQLIRAISPDAGGLRGETP